MWLPILVLLLAVVLAKSQVNLLSHGDFENPNSIRPWKCIGCKSSGSRDSFGGNWCVMVKQRNQSWSVLTQEIQSFAGKNYVFKSYIKLLNVARRKMYTTIHVYIQYNDIHGKIIKKRFVDLPKQQVSFGWTELGGDVFIPDLRHMNRFSLSIEIPEYEVDYLLDNATLTVMPHNPSWKSEAITSIDRLRKAQLTLTPIAHSSNPHYCIVFSSSYCIIINQMYVEIKQTKSQYAFGSTVMSDKIVGKLSQAAYTPFVYKNFEWALLKNELKWKNMEPQRGVITNDTAVEAVQHLRDHRVKVWGSGLFSALRHNNPDWITKLTLTDKQKSIDDRFDIMSSKFKDSFDNVDVYSDTLLDDFFETSIHSANITEKLFNTAKSKFPSTKLFLNENFVLNSSIHTTAYANMAKRLKMSHCPVYGLGIKAHFYTHEIDMDVMKYRLDKLAEANLPLWISSLAIHDTNVTRRARKLDDVMTLLYSYPEVEGIVFDESWDGENMANDAALVNGVKLQLNEVGLVYVNRWHTHDIYHFISTVSLRGYKGEYDIKVHKGGPSGAVIYTRHITLDRAGQSMTIHVTGQGPNYQVTNIVFG